MKTLFVVLFSFSSLVSTLGRADDKIDLKKDFSSLGDNEAVIERARALDPKNKYKVVQSRLVDRHLRLEVGVNYGLIGGGDTYYNTQNLGANLDFHISPYWSIGARYYHSYNALTPEGEAAFSDAASRAALGQPYRLPAIDYPTDTTLAVVNWYPIYGKLNLFNMGVSHFDIYLQGGYGKTNLSSGAADTFAAGAGFGFWINQWMTMRLESRYQTYTDHPYFDTPNAFSRQINEVVAMASVGILL